MSWLGATSPLLGAESTPLGAAHDCDGATGVSLGFCLEWRRGRNCRSEACNHACGKKSGQERAARQHIHYSFLRADASRRRSLTSSELAARAVSPGSRFFPRTPSPCNLMLCASDIVGGAVAGERPQSAILQRSAPAAHFRVPAWCRAHSSTSFPSFLIGGYGSMSFHDGPALCGGGPFA